MFMINSSFYYIGLCLFQMSLRRSIYIIHKWTDILCEYIFLVIFSLIITYAGSVCSYILTGRWIEFDLNECLKITKSILNQAFSK